MQTDPPENDATIEQKPKRLSMGQILALRRAAITRRLQGDLVLPERPSSLGETDPSDAHRSPQ
jgi:hypothetical protein